MLDALLDTSIDVLKASPNATRKLDDLVRQLTAHRASLQRQLARAIAAEMKLDQVDDWDARAADLFDAVVSERLGQERLTARSHQSEDIERMRRQLDQLEARLAQAKSARTLLGASDILESSMRDIRAREAEIEAHLEMVGPGEALNALVQEHILATKEELVACKRRVAVAIAEEKRLQRTLQKQEEDAAQWTERAEKAHSYGDGSLAREAQEEAERHHAKHRETYNTWAQQKHKIGGLRKLLRNIQDTITLAARQQLKIRVAHRHDEIRPLMTELFLLKASPSRSSTRIQRLTATFKKHMHAEIIDRKKLEDRLRTSETLIDDWAEKATLAKQANKPILLEDALENRNRHADHADHARQLLEVVQAHIERLRTLIANEEKAL